MHRRRRLLTILGNTFGNLDNEIGFIRSILTGLVHGIWDLLLLDVSLTHAPPTSPTKSSAVIRLSPRRGSQNSSVSSTNRQFSIWVRCGATMVSWHKSTSP